MFNWQKNLLNLMRKQEGKTKGLINKKPPKLNEETKRKTDLQGLKLFIKGEKSEKPQLRKRGRKPGID